MVYVLNIRIRRRLISLIVVNGSSMLLRLYISMFWCSSVVVVVGWKCMLCRVSGISVGIIRVLKISVVSIVLCGFDSCIMFSVVMVGMVVVNSVGRIVKYLEMLLVSEKVVSVSWVISCCLFIFIIVSSLVGFELRLIMLLVFFVVCVLEFIVRLMLVWVSVGVLLVLLLIIVISWLLVCFWWMCVSLFFGWVLVMQLLMLVLVVMVVVVSGLLLVIIIVWMFIVCSCVNFLCMLCLIMFDSLIMFSMW